MELHERQRRHLEAVIEWAGKIRTILGPVLEAHGDRVHFRPASKGVAMVGLRSDRPQRGKSGLTNLERVARDFEALFVQNCRDVPHGRVTGEKALQSFLIAEAHQNERRLVSINRASSATTDPVELVFVTDEIPLPVEGGKIVCDILALRRDGGRSTPVLIELKDSRMLTRLVEQVESYAALMNEHSAGFEQLFTAILGEQVRFDDRVERWIVWPALSNGSEPREQALAEKRIRIVGYEGGPERYTFRVGSGRPSCPACGSSEAAIRKVYGEPTAEAYERAKQGEFMLAGCLIFPESRTWRCKRCDQDFGPLVRP